MSDGTTGVSRPARSVTPITTALPVDVERRLAELVPNPEDFDFVASPLRRTRETMELVRAGMGLPARGYRVDARLMEVHFGDWQGFTHAELEERQPGSTAARFADKWGFVAPGPSGESYQMLLDRVRPWYEALEKPTICVTHGGVLRILFRLVEDMPVADVAMLEIGELRRQRNSIFAAAVNDDRDLAGNAHTAGFVLAACLTHLCFYYDFISHKYL